METKKMIRLAMFISLVFVATTINIHIPVGLGTGGLMHLGTLTMFVIALKYGPFFGAWSGGVGMALFDVLSIWAIWAPGTFVVRLVAGYAVGRLALSQQGQGTRTLLNIMALAVGGAIIIVGYFIYEAVFLGLGILALSSVLGNVVQVVIGFGSLLLIKALPALDGHETT